MDLFTLCFNDTKLVYLRLGIPVHKAPVAFGIGVPSSLSSRCFDHSEKQPTSVFKFYLASVSEMYCKVPMFTAVLTEDTVNQSRGTCNGLIFPKATFPTVIHFFFFNMISNIPPTNKFDKDSY